jgi:hypothetical protein
MADPWPTPHQELLLKAALLQGDLSIQAWAQWKAQIDLDVEHVDRGSYRLFALVHRNLSEQDMDDPLLSRLKGVSRLFWTRNQTLLRAVAPAFHELCEAAIDPLLMDDAGLSLFYFGDLGLWPMDEFVVLIPRSCVWTAAAVVTGAGWRPKWLKAQRLDDEFLFFTDSLRFHNDQGQVLRLRWRLAGQGCGESNHMSPWTRTEQASCNGETFGVISAADQLLETIAGGLLPGPSPTIDWLIAAARILVDANETMDWAGLLERAARSRLVLVLQETVDYLDRTLGVTMQVPHRETLAVLPVSRAEHREFVTSTRHFPLLGGLPSICLRYQRTLLQQDPDTTWLATVLHFPGYLQLQLRHRHLGKAVWWLIKRTMARIKLAVNDISSQL